MWCLSPLSPPSFPPVLPPHPAPFPAFCSHARKGKKGSRILHLRHVSLRRVAGLLVLKQSLAHECLSAQQSWRPGTAEGSELSTPDGCRLMPGRTLAGLQRFFRHGGGRAAGAASHGPAGCVLRPGMRGAGPSRRRRKGRLSAFHLGTHFSGPGVDPRRNQQPYR